MKSIQLNIKNFQRCLGKILKGINCSSVYMGYLSVYYLKYIQFMISKWT